MPPISSSEPAKRHSAYGTRSSRDCACSSAAPRPARGSVFGSAATAGAAKKNRRASRRLNDTHKRKSRPEEILHLVEERLRTRAVRAGILVVDRLEFAQE